MSNTPSSNMWLCVVSWVLAIEVSPWKWKSVRLGPTCIMFNVCMENVPQNDLTLYKAYFGFCEWYDSSFFSELICPSNSIKQIIQPVIQDWLCLFPRGSSGTTRPAWFLATLPMEAESATVSVQRRLLPVPWLVKLNPVGFREIWVTLSRHHLQFVLRTLWWLVLKSVVGLEDIYSDMVWKLSRSNPAESLLNLPGSFTHGQCHDAEGKLGDCDSSSARHRS